MVTVLMFLQIFTEDAHICIIYIVQLMLGIYKNDMKKI